MRDFFEQQHVARRLSTQLALVLIGAVFGTVVVTAAVLAGLATLLAMLQVMVTTRIEIEGGYWIEVFVVRFWLATALVGTIVIGVAVVRTIQAMESGGAELARQLGGTRIPSDSDNPQYQQLMNVVEELSIATSAPAPKVFVLEDEDEINAFAAGIDPRDTVIGVTQGALARLNRSQLQGVLAHEFSHIVNRDVKINVQTIGALQGIEVIDSAANFLLGMGATSRVNGSMLATVFGYALWLVGQIGMLFGAIVRMALNRQREFLADAAAVQFTRFPEGLCSALKLVAALELQGERASRAAHSASHFFFVGGESVLDRLLATHPPLTSRIRRLDPEWDGTLPAVLPTVVAAVMDQPQSESLDEEQGDTTMPPAAKAVATDGDSPVTSQPVDEPLVGQAGDADGDVSSQTVSDADKEAFLAALAQARAKSAHQEYNPDVTHWPTLAATAAALILGLLLFSWLTSG